MTEKRTGSRTSINTQLSFKSLPGVVAILLAIPTLGVSLLSVWAAYKISHPERISVDAEGCVRVYPKKWLPNTPPVEECEIETFINAEVGFGVQGQTIFSLPTGARALRLRLLAPGHDYIDHSSRKSLNKSSRLVGVNSYFAVGGRDAIERFAVDLIAAGIRDHEGRRFPVEEQTSDGVS